MGLPDLLLTLPCLPDFCPEMLFVCPLVITDEELLVVLELVALETVEILLAVLVALQVPLDELLLIEDPQVVVEVPLWL